MDEHHKTSRSRTAAQTVFDDPHLFPDIFRLLSTADRLSLLLVSQETFKLGVGEKWKRAPLRRVWDAEVYAEYPDEKTAARGELYLDAITEISLGAMPFQTPLFTRKNIRATLEELGRLCPNLHEVAEIPRQQRLFLGYWDPDKEFLENEYTRVEYGESNRIAVVHYCSGFPKLLANKLRLFSSAPRKEGRRPKWPMVKGLPNRYEIILDLTATPFSQDSMGSIEQLLNDMLPDMSIIGVVVASSSISAVFRLLDLLDTRFPSKRLKKLWLFDVPMDRVDFERLCQRLDRQLHTLSVLHNKTNEAPLLDMPSTCKFAESIPALLPQLAVLEIGFDFTKVSGLGRADIPITARSIKSGSLRNLRLSFAFDPEASEDKLSTGAFLAAMRNLFSLVAPNGTVRRYTCIPPMGMAQLHLTPTQFHPLLDSLHLTTENLFAHLNRLTKAQLDVVFKTMWTISLSDLATLLMQAKWDDNNRILSEEARHALNGLATARRFFIHHERQLAYMTSLKEDAERKLSNSGFAVEKMLAAIEEEAKNQQAYIHPAPYPPAMPYAWY